MLHSLDSPLSVNSSPVAFNDFSKTSIDDVDKYNALNDNPMIYDLDFPRFDLYEDDLSSISASTNNNNLSFGFLPQMNYQSNLAFDPIRTDLGDLNKENDSTEPNSIFSKSDKDIPTCSQRKGTEIRKKTPKIMRKKPIVLRPFVSVWAVEMCVKKLKEFQEGVSSDDQE